jgi:hypothetical protein
MRLTKYRLLVPGICEAGSATATKLHATEAALTESNSLSRVGGETAMNDRFKERFSVNELTALRNDLLQGGLIDSREAAELLQVFLMGRGYGVSPQAAFDAAGRVEMSGCSIPVLQTELENLALVM